MSAFEMAKRAGLANQKATPAVALGSYESHDMLAAYGAWGEKSMSGRH